MELPIITYITQKPKPITAEFLVEKGWKIVEDKPMYTILTKNDIYSCCVGKFGYGQFSLSEYHWLNRDQESPVRTFKTLGRQIMEEDYDSILNLTGMKP